MKKKYSNKPDYQLMTPVGDGDKTKWREVAAGWSNDDGSISIVLGACVTIDYTHKLLLYPVEKKPLTQSSTGG